MFWIFRFGIFRSKVRRRHWIKQKWFEMRLSGTCHGSGTSCQSGAEWEKRSDSAYRGEYTFFMTTQVVALTLLYFLSFLLSFSRQLHLVKRSSVKARQREWAVEAASAKWRACVLRLRMQLCDASVGVKSRREVQPEVCGAGRQWETEKRIKTMKLLHVSCGS